jgi:hypothetical protein
MLGIPSHPPLSSSPMCVTNPSPSLSALWKIEEPKLPRNWPRFKFFALVYPENDILPVRTVYNGTTQNIGVNYLTSKEPIWFAGPDLIASILLTGKVPRIEKAIRVQPWGEGKVTCLERRNLRVNIKGNERDVSVKNLLGEWC